MELPVVQPNDTNSAEAMIRAIKRVERILARTAAEETELDGATVYTNPQRPLVHMTNWAGEVCIPEGDTADDVLGRIDRHFEEAGSRCWMMHASEARWPPDLAGALIDRGYIARRHRVYRLSNYAKPKSLNESLQIIPARAAYQQVRELAVDYTLTQYGCDPTLADELADTFVDHLDEPREESYLARLGGEPVGAICLVTLGQTGVIESLATREGFRKQGVATALLAHTIDHCQRALFENVILDTQVDNETAIRLYEKLGFEHIADYELFVHADGA